MSTLLVVGDIGAPLREQRLIHVNRGAGVRRHSGRRKLPHTHDGMRRRKRQFVVGGAGLTEPQSAEIQVPAMSISMCSGLPCTMVSLTECMV